MNGDYSFAHKLGKARDFELLTPVLSTFGEEREKIFVGRFPGVARLHQISARQPRANFRSAFSAFEFASIREIRVNPLNPCPSVFIRG
jgi:hypothetical protein